VRATQVLLLALVCFACKQPEAPNLDRALKDNLFQMRKAIENFHQDHQRYPYSLEELVPRYILRIPADPITKSASTWQVITEETVQPNADFTTSTTGTAAPRPGIIDVRSGAGAPYSNY
jgi:general secretion pathway protein G